MEVISIAEHQRQKKERWKREVLGFIDKELSKVDPSNFEDVGQKVKEYADLMAHNYTEPGAAARQRESLRKDYPEIFKGGEP